VRELREPAAESEDSAFQRDLKEIWRGIMKEEVRIYGKSG